METNKIALKQMLGTKEAVTYLEDLVKSFQAGKIVVQQGDDYVDLQTPEMVDLKVEAKVKKDKSKFSLELSWRNTSVESDAAVTITSTAPAEKKQSASPAKTPENKIESPPSDEEEIYFGPGSGKKKSAAANPANPKT